MPVAGTGCGCQDSSTALYTTYEIESNALRRYAVAAVRAEWETQRHLLGVGLLDDTLECREFRAHAGAQRNREKCGEFRREKREWKERDETARA